MVRWQKIAAFLMIIIVSSGVVIRPDAQAAPPAQEPVPQLVVWWPDALRPANRDDATLETEFNRYRSNSTTGLTVRYRRYTAGEQVAELALIQEVAPTAMPDLTLMQQNDFLQAVEMGLLQPLDGWIPNTILQELASISPNLLSFGQVNGVFYGFPYLLSVGHMIYQSNIYVLPPTDFSDYLTTEVPFLFPTGHPADQAVNNFLLTQYLASGGRLQTEDNIPVLDADPLLEILEFYEAALEIELYDPAENYEVSSSPGYREQITRNNQIIAFIDSHHYMNDLNRRFADYQALPVPTASGIPYALVEGWVWVLLKEDPETQSLATDFVSEMMRPDSLSRTALALNMLPAQQGALRYADNAYFKTATVLLEAAYYLPPDVRSNPAAAALQEAFKSVSRGTSPAEAVQNALDSLALE